MKKNYNLELIRTISFVFVVVIHVSNYFCRAYGNISTGEYVFSLLLDTAARLSVPCFFMISGALLLGKEEPLKKHFSRLSRFVVVLVFWSTVYYLFNTFYRKTPYDLRDLFEVPTEAHLWYLYAMIPIYIVLPFFQVMCRGMNQQLEKAFMIMLLVAVVFFVYVPTFLKTEAFYDVPIVGDKVYSAYLFLGYYLWKYKVEIGKRIGRKGLLAITAVCLAVTAAATMVISVRLGDHYERLLEYTNPFIIVGSMAFFSYMLQLQNGNVQLPEKVRNVVDTWCSCSFGIYLIHILFLDMYKQNFKATAFSAWAALPLLTAGILVLSFGCVWLVRRTSIGRRLT